MSTAGYRCKELIVRFLFFSIQLKASLVAQRVKNLPPRQKTRASQVALAVKNPPANAGDIRDVGLIPGPGRSPGGGHGNPLQYSCLENPMDR